ncbi:MAG: adenylyltransferase/cytidyltransferase family protein [Bacteroidales bacterium]|nr:adenylyltransferase/cytidyltransferase family protein [Bacteroidales bacterium]
MKVFVSGCYDMLHSGHVAFFKEASQYGDLYVSIGSDRTLMELKGRRPINSERERLYMVKSIRYVTDAFIGGGSGMLDFLDVLERVQPDIFVVNEDGHKEVKEQLCKERGIEYKVLQRIPDEGLEARSTTALRTTPCQLPTRLDLAGTWIDQPYVSCLAPGWAITISLEPTFDILERCGMSTSTRNAIRKVWPYYLPDMDPFLLAKLTFCFENEPEKGGPVSGAQDAIGICIPGLVRHYYDNHYWPTQFEVCDDEETLLWLESHLCLSLMFPRRDGCSVVEGMEINHHRVHRLAHAADQCWAAIMQLDFEQFATSYRLSFESQIAMFPGMMQPGVQEYIDRYKAMPEVKAWKMAGAGGGGYLALVVDDSAAFVKKHPECINIKIRRRFQ